MCRERVWLLTVVAKQDLWADRADELTPRYRDGEYGTAVGRIAAGKDCRSFRSELVFASLVINNLVDAADVHLARNVSGYDQPQQVASVLTLFRTLAQLKAWEDQV